MGKKGSAHLEMILAFTIFLVAVVFLLVYIRPLETTKISDVAVISLKNEFVREVSTELITIFMNGSVKCIPSEGIPSDVIGLNSTSESLTATNYYLLFSEEFDTSLGACMAEDNVRRGSISRTNVLSNKSLYELQEKYYSNYSGLKEDLKVPRALNFEIRTRDGTISMTREDSDDIDIIAKSYTLSVLDSSGRLINKEFIFRAW
jgi:hypothetical protein